MKNGNRALKIAIVGPCAAGKSTLRQVLEAAGYEQVSNPAQEHSYVADMWQKVTRPEVLIYLDVDYPAARQRRPQEDRGEQGVAEQKKRLAHARRHADLYIDTNPIDAAETAARVLAFLDKRSA